MKRVNIIFIFLLLLIPLKVGAYYSKSVSKTSSFSTKSFTDLSLSTNLSTIGICNRNGSFNLTISNSNSYQVSYGISFNDASLSYTIDGTSVQSTYTIGASASKTHTIVISGSTSNSSFSITITSQSPYSKSQSLTINLDKNCPSCSFSGPTTTKIKSGGSTSYDLTCTDSTGIKDINLTASSFNLSSSNISIGSVSRTTVTNGYKYTINVVGGTGNGNATISLKSNIIKDNNENAAAAVTSSSVNIDNTPMSCSFGSWGNSPLVGGSNTTITLICSDPNSGTPRLNTLTSSSFQVSNNAFTVSNVIVSSSGSTYTYTITVTGNTTTTEGTLTLKAGVVFDDVGNSNTAITSSSLNVIGDTTGPRILFDPSSDNNYSKSKNVNVSIVDDSGVSVAKYVWTTSNTQNASSGTSFTLVDDAASITKNGLTGEYYLCIYANDIYNNSTNECTGPFYFDNAGPVITANDFCVASGYAVSPVAYATFSDNNSGISSVTSKVDGVVIDNLSSIAVGSHTVTYTATDALGNISTATSTVTVYTDIVSNPSSGLVNDPFSEDDGRKVYRGSNPNNYLSFNGEVWRILGVELDGAYKIVSNDLQPAREYNNVASTATTQFIDTTLYTYLNTTYLNGLQSSLPTAIYRQIMQDHTQRIGMQIYYAQSTSTYIKSLVGQEKVLATNVTEEQAKFAVGVMNTSDYIKASTNSNCSPTNKLSDSENCKNSNYLYTSNVDQMFMNPYRYQSGSAYGSFGVHKTYGYLINAAATTAKQYHVILFLKPDTKFIGSGTSSDPYIIAPTCSVTSSATCEITTTSGVDSSKELTAVGNSNGTTISNYSWNTGEVGNSIVVTTPGVYTATLIDTDGATNSCAITINSKRVCRDRNCVGTITPGEWYDTGASFVQNCSVDSNGTDWRRVCSAPYKPQGSGANATCQVSFTAVSTMQACGGICNSFLNSVNSVSGGQNNCSCNCLTQAIDQHRDYTCSSWSEFSDWTTTELTSSWGVEAECHNDLDPVLPDAPVDPITITVTNSGSSYSIGSVSGNKVGGSFTAKCTSNTGATITKMEYIVKQNGTQIASGQKSSGTYTLSTAADSTSGRYSIKVRCTDSTGYVTSDTTFIRYIFKRVCASWSGGTVSGNFTCVSAATGDVKGTVACTNLSPASWQKASNYCVNKGFELGTFGCTSTGSCSSYDYSL